MKKLTCEMCGSTDLVKQDGIFVCQACGTKYSVEEAKKMMIEGTVDVSGSTVKVDDTDKINNYMTMAQNARNSGNNKEAEEYCNKIIEIDPKHTEAWLLKGIAAAWQSTLANNRIGELLTGINNACTNAKTEGELTSLAERGYKEYYKIVLAINSLKVENLVKFPSKNTYMSYIQFPLSYTLWDINIESAYATAFNKLHEDLPEDKRPKPESLSGKLQLGDLDYRCKSELVNGGIKLWNKSLSTYKASNDGHPTDYAVDQMCQNGNIAMLMLGTVVPDDLSTAKADDKKKDIIIKACNNLIKMNTIYMDLKSYKINFSNGVKSYTVSKSITLEKKQTCTKNIRKYHDTIKFYDPSYTVPTVEEPNELKKSGCYVATVVYGSYDCPQVWTLRRYRDYKLAESWYGRAFIRTYYVISPTLVKWFGHTAWFKNLWRGKLDRMVSHLNSQGVEDTPYQDRTL